MGKPRHPFKRGQTIRCIRAPEVGIPITEGENYTVKRAFIGDPDGCERTEIPGMENTPGVELVELPENYFTADRFEEAH
ncbi:hypothetical protein [Rhizobium sp. CECT 9324]|uniref:hypothetical protein n=1 Tax=Rhizobium sp. CECT 9324 TaxID=2845820 RepID=UPI001E3F36B6|nr:hypothetical protein [Rhizobium sp. CECT 9324]CAH0338384.1 hypothetical protein RHI9324_00005 [Rhizobium sp. CECT 9324]CAH0343746.1 hypothetical protein RHI9324_05483 [Rhizobium sp. CECT 9324]